MRNLFSFATNHRDFLLITYVQLNDQRQPREPADRIGAFTKVNRVSGIERSYEQPPREDTGATVSRPLLFCRGDSCLILRGAKQILKVGFQNVC